MENRETFGMGTQPSGNRNPETGRDAERNAGYRRSISSGRKRTSGRTYKRRMAYDKSKYHIRRNAARRRADFRYGSGGRQRIVAGRGGGPYRRKSTRWGKLALILCGLLLLALLAYRGMRRIAPGPEGEYLELGEAQSMAWLLADTAGLPEADSLAELFAKEETEGEMLTFELWEQVAGIFPDCGYVLPDYYKKKDKVLLTDWFDFFDRARSVYDAQGNIRDVELTPLAVGGMASGPDGERLKEDELISEQRIYSSCSARLMSCLFLPVTAVERDGVLYAVRRINGESSRLSNLWIMEVDQEGLLGFWNDCEIRISAPEGAAGELGAVREQVADLNFTDGALSGVDIKTEKVSGKLLKLRDGGAEIEGQGFFPFSEDVKVYRLYGKLKAYSPSELRIGYDFTDFVVEKGEIQAALVVKEETMENIRVLVKSSDYGSAFHDAVELTADCDLTISSGEEQTRTLPAGESLQITAESELFASDYIHIEPSVLTGRIRLSNVARSQGVPSYRGSLELERTQDGIVVINEVLLEEYLYAVVPSEMPSSYPLEALKAQAVCARTYAYARMLHAGLPAYGAHVDDSAGFQVYNNISENVETTRAVRETKGELLYYGDALADTYYYSTSCGYGTNTAVWSGSVPEDYPYLRAKAVNVAGVTDAQGDTIDSEVNLQDIEEAAAMSTEEQFAAFIKEGRESDFESGEAWYRWTYQVEQLDGALLYANVVKRYEASHGSVFVRQADGSYVNQAPADPGRITGLYIARRNQGGVAEELVIEGEKGTLMVKSELNIRYCLSDGTSKVIRQDGSEYSAGALLPSAFFILEAGIEDGYVVGYTLTGGGFGHGVGLSQNGARSMAEKGCAGEDILAFFYEGSSVKAVY